VGFDKNLFNEEGIYGKSFFLDFDFGGGGRGKLKRSFGLDRFCSFNVSFNLSD
jgi:hypothetical protein